jgi:hypothetical protein
MRTKLTPLSLKDFLKEALAKRSVAAIVIASKCRVRLPLDVVPIFGSLWRQTHFSRRPTEHRLLTLLNLMMVTHH